MMDWNGNSGSWNGGMILIGLFWLVLIALAVWAAVRTTRRPQDPAGTSVESARAILDRRFASGGIDAEAYAESRRVLEGRSVDKINS